MSRLSQGSKRATAHDWLSLIRPANSVMVGFAVIVGIAVSSSPGSQISEILTLRSLFGFLTGFAISSFSMITNDIYDFQVDKVNQPDRPIASERVSIKAAYAYSILFLIVGLAASFFVGLVNLSIAEIFALIGWYYNYHGKKLGLGGNSLVALSLAIPYIYGSVELGNYSINLAYSLALTSFLAGMGREVLKGISDIAGDKIRSIKSIAISYGIVGAKRVSASFFLLAVVSSILPVAISILGRSLFVYVVLVAITDIVFCYLAAKTLKLVQEKESLKLKKIALAGMMLGLLAYLIAGLYR